MAKLDRFLEVLTTQDARQLRLVAGESPTLVFPDGERPASQAKPSADQLLVLLGELITADELEALKSTGSLEARIARPGMTTMLLTARSSAGRVEADISPAAASSYLDQAEAPSPAAAVITPENLPQTDSAPSPAVDVSFTATGGGPKIDALFRVLVARGASDLHLSSDERPMLRIDGELTAIDDFGTLEANDVAELIDPITPEENRIEFRDENDSDFAYEIPGLARFRCNVFQDRKGPGAVFRFIPTKILTAAQLGLPAKTLELCRLTKGLVLVTGPTGSGKSTTLAALIDHINTIRKDHIITIEDPIEFVHENRNCLVNQREVRNHTESYKRALRAALREDPDIILIGELRDLETIAIAIETAETGHLVFGTLHTTTAISTIDRIIDQFPAEQQAQIRTMLAESLKAVISQTLCRKKEGGRVAALEILIGLTAVSKLIREGKTFQIPSIMQTGKKYGMVMLNEALMELIKQDLVEPEEVYLKAVDKLGIVQQLKNAGCDLSFLEKDKEAALV